MIKNYFFTVTNGRSGQATLNKYIRLYAKDCLSAFEEPNINPIFSGFISDIEKKIRRKYFETHELLGRGKVLEAYQERKFEYIKKIALLRLNKVNKDAHYANANIYFDISKFYVRGLYKGFNSILKNFNLVFLVRDPLLNMKSYINRNKNFFLDNSHPNSKNNILIIKEKLIKEELYLWSWSETLLRYNKISKSKKVKKNIIIETNALDEIKKVKKIFDLLGIKYSPLKKVDKVNTNEETGNIKTEIKKKDIIILKNFIKKIPKDNKSLIMELDKSVSINESVMK